MRLQDMIHQALAGARRHRSRATLVLVELIVGIAAVTIVLGLSAGLNADYQASMDAMGRDVIAIQFHMGALDTGIQPSMDRAYADMGGLVGACPSVEAVTKVDSIPFVLQRAQGESVDTTGMQYVSNPLRVDDSFERVFRPKMLHGTWFTSSDEQAGIHGAIITSKLAKALFGKENAVGEELHFHSSTKLTRTFVVTGILDSSFRFPKYGMVPVGVEAEEYVAFIPDWAMPLSIGTVKVMNEGASRYWAIARSEGAVSAAVKEIDRYLSPIREKIVYSVTSAHELLAKEWEGTQWMVIAVSIFAWSVLIIASFGLSGIMFIAVRERMKEIGIRSSLGAAPSEIIGQFMLEVVALSLVGGIGGIVLAAAIFGLISPMDLPRAAGIGAYLKAAGLSITLGIIAGCYPAIQAGLKSPVKALERTL